MNRKTRHRLWRISALLLASGAVHVSGCGKKEADKSAQATVVDDTPPPPPPPEKIEVATLVQQLKADKRVQFPEAVAPTDEWAARAVIQFADGLARGDAEMLRPMMDANAREILEMLEASGQWEDATKRIEAVRVVELRPAAIDLTVRRSSSDRLATMSNLTADQFIAFAEAQAKARGADFGDAEREVIRQRWDSPEFKAGLKDAADQIKAMENADPRFAAAMAELQKSNEPTPPADDSGDGSNRGYALRLAIQEPGRSYVSDWYLKDTGGVVVFLVNPDSPSGTRPRATDWESAGAPLPPPEEEAPAESPPAEASPSEPDAGGATKRRGG